jgi:hypothetical protein
MFSSDNQFHDEDSGNDTIMRDVLMGALGVLAAVLVILVFHINPPKKEDADNQRARGNIRIEVIWDVNQNVDIDTWVQAPGDTPVGYSNLNGLVFNLVRDDLGNHNDLSNMNYEVAFSRGIPPGKWVVNLHWFSNSQGAQKVPVKVLITMKKDDGEHSKSSPVKIMSKSVVLGVVGEEKTVVSFEIDENMNLVDGSYSFDLIKLRTAR